MTKRQKIQNYCKQLLAEKPDRHIELALTLAISFFAAVQLIVTCSNNFSTSDQTEKMILITQRNERAATKIADASKRNAAAAESFSASAGGINQGVGNAVVKLNLQAEQSSKLAAAALEANGMAKLTLEAQMSSTRAVLDIGDLRDADVIRDMTSFNFRVMNSGETTASNIYYTISQPIPVTWQIGDPRNQIEMAVKRGASIGPNPMTGSILPILGKDSASVPIPIKSKINDPVSMHIMDLGVFFLGQLDFEDIYGYQWERHFCVMLGADLGPNRAKIAGNAPSGYVAYRASDCNISQENLHRRVKPEGNKAHKSKK